jgi:hypothetical protein
VESPRDTWNKIDSALLNGLLWFAGRVQSGSPPCGASRSRPQRRERPTYRGGMTVIMGDGLRAASRSRKRRGGRSAIALNLHCTLESAPERVKMEVIFSLPECPANKPAAGYCRASQR